MTDDSSFPSSTPVGYMSPQQLQAYIKALQGSTGGGGGQQAPIYTGAQAALHVLGNLGQTAALQTLMKRSQAGQQQNAALALPGAGAQDSGGAPAAPAPAPAGGQQGQPPELSGTAPASAPDNDLFGFIKAHEGYSAHAYPDGRQTSIGWGTKATSPNETITPEEATGRLNNEVTHAAGSVQGFAPQAPDGVKRALTDLTYNTGTKWQQSGLGQAIQAGDYDTAKKLFVQYNHADGQVLPGLTERRSAAAQWFPGGQAPNASAGPAGAPTGMPATGGPRAPSAGAPAAPPAAGPDPFGPRTGTFVNPANLPGRPPRNWRAIQQRWGTLSPQQQQDYIKEYNETNGGQNPMSFDMPNGAGKIMYHPENPSQQTLYPKINTVETADASGNKRPYQNVLDPITSKEMWRNGEAPPTAAESIAGAGQMAGSKSLAESDVKAYGSLHSGLAGAAMTSTNQLPYISAAEQQLNDPNFYSGAGEGINLAWKRVLSGLGIDPGAALPQEAFRKTMAANILQQVNNLRAEQEAMGVQGGRIFGTQIDLMEKAAQNPSNTLPANKYLTGIARWGAERARTIGDEADDYKIAHGQLDAAFEKQLRADLVNPEKYPAPPKLSDFEGKPSAQASPPLTTPPIPAPTPSPPSGMPPGTTMASSAAAPAGRNFLGTTPPPPSPAAPLPSAGGGADITRELGTANPIAQALMQGDNPIAGMTQEERKNHAMMHAGVLAGALPFTPGVAGKVAPLAWNTTKWLAKEGIHNLYLGEVLKALGH